MAAMHLSRISPHSSVSSVLNRFPSDGQPLQGKKSRTEIAFGPGLVCGRRQLRSGSQLIPVMIAVVVVIAILRSECYSAIHLAGFCPPNGLELVEGIVPIIVAIVLGQRGGLQAIGDFHELVRVSALISGSADS